MNQLNLDHWHFETRRHSQRQAGMRQGRIFVSRTDLAGLLQHFRSDMIRSQAMCNLHQLSRCGVSRCRSYSFSFGHLRHLHGKSGLEANSRDLMPGTFVQFQIFEATGHWVASDKTLTWYVYVWYAW